MFDATDPPPPAIDLLLSPDDTAQFVGFYNWTTHAGRTEPSHLFVVLHRQHGLWTHAYRAVADRRPGRLLVHVLRVKEGDATEVLREWLLDQVTGARA